MRVVSLACDTPLYQILSYGQHKISASGEITHKEESESCLFCMVHASSSSLSNIIKICLRVSKLWSAQDFGFRGDNYKMKKVRVVSCM